MMSNTRARLAPGPAGDGRPRNSSSRMPYRRASLERRDAHDQRRIVRVTVIAVNIETRTPMIRTRAKPWIVGEPNLYRIDAVIRLDTFESRIEFQARLKPASIAGDERLAGPQLLLRPLEDQDVGVDRHADREDEAGDAGQGQGHRDEPEEGVHDERVVDERGVGQDARQPVVDEHEQEDQGDPDAAAEQALAQERGAQRRR